MPPKLIINGSSNNISSPFLSVNGGNSPIPEQPTFAQKAISAVKNYADESAQTVNTFGNAILHPVDTYNKIGSTFLDPFMEGVNKAGEALGKSYSDRGTTQLADIANIITGASQAAFAPVTGLFHMAENTPGLKQAADVMNLPFTVAGVAGGYTSGKIIDVLPISQASKDILKQPIKDLGSLAAQVFVGGAIMKYVEGYAKQGKPITPEIAKTIVEDTKTQTADHPIVQNDTPPPPPLKVNTPESISKPGENINSASKIETAPIKESISTQSLDTKTIETDVSKRAIEPNVNTRAQSLMQAEVEKKMVEEMGDVPTHEIRNMAEKAKNATDYVLSNPENTIKVLNGELHPGGDVLPQDVYTAAEVQYMKTGDQNLRQALINSEIPTKTGQSLKALDSTDLHSPIRIERDIRHAKEAVIEKKTGRTINKVKSDVANEIKKSIKKVGVTKETWSSFIESVKCNY